MKALPPFDAAARRGVTVRALTDADLPFVEALYAASRADEVAATGWPEALQTHFLAEQHRAQHRHYQHHYPGLHWLILEAGGAAIGRLYLAEWEREFRVVDISIAAPAQRRGIATALFADLQRAAATSGKAVSIHVEKHNPARRLYRRLGFELAEDKGIYDLMEWRPATVVEG